MALAYSRALLKISGEALAGDKGFGLDYHMVESFAEEIKAVHALGVHPWVGWWVHTEFLDLGGEVAELYELPQGIMLDVKTTRESVIIPYRPEIVVKTDIGARTILINDTLGFLDSDSDSED